MKVDLYITLRVMFHTYNILLQMWPIWRDFLESEGEKIEITTMQEKVTFCDAVDNAESKL